MLSSDEIKIIAEQAFNDQQIEVIEYHLSPYSMDKVGFLGHHQNLHITIRHNKNNKTQSVRLFVKMIPSSSEQQAQFIKDQGIFNREALFLNSMVPHLTENYIGDDWCPKCYLANDSVIVLEDMRIKGYSMMKDKLFKEEYLKSASKAQARLHAASILAEARIGKPLNELCPESCTEVIFSEKLVEYHRLELYSDLAEQIAKILNKDHRKIKAAFNQAFLRLYRSESKRKFTHVISHGDAWPNNSLFDQSKPPKCVLVDFQLVRYALRMFDVALLIYLSTTQEIRKKEERQAIEAYHKELCDTLKKNNPKLERPSLEDLLEEYEDARISAIFCAVVYYPIICLDQEILKTFKNDEEALYKEIMFRGNNRVILELYDQHPNYANRLNDVVTELIDYCEKLNVNIENELLTIESLK